MTMPIAMLAPLTTKLADRAFMQTEAAFDVYLRRMADGDVAGASRALNRAAAWSAVTLALACVLPDAHVFPTTTR